VTPSVRPRAPSAARERILKTAHDLFYRDGVRATGIDRVIAEAQVTKVTFYRHFRSKDELIREFLEYRHQRWMSWFVDALARHGARPSAIAAALREWLQKPEFRGCAFINVVAEMPDGGPQISAIARSHKEDMRRAIEQVLPPSPRRAQIASSLALAFDGAIVRAQMDGNDEPAVAGLKAVVTALLRPESDRANESAVRSARATARVAGNR
jgi:AcrR family transcriptional regulator